MSILISMFLTEKIFNYFNVLGKTRKLDYVLRFASQQKFSVFLNIDIVYTVFRILVNAELCAIKFTNTTKNLLMKKYLVLCLISFFAR